MQKNRVSSEPVMGAVRLYCEKNNLLVEEVCCKARVNPNTIAHHIQKGRTTLDFDIADRLLCAIGMPQLWRDDPVLREDYVNCVLSDHVVPLFDPVENVCANPECGRTFLRGRPQEFCSTKCTAKVHAHKGGGRGGRGKAPRLVPQKAVA